MRITRYSMYQNIFKNLSLPLDGEILGISGLKYWRGSKNYSPPIKVFSENAKITEAHFPEVNICSLPFENNTFDFIINDQVLEHVEGNIFQAIEECKRVLKPGGILIIGTTFIQPIHYGPKDLWRFSPEGLRFLCKDFSQIIECGSWGNRWIHALFFIYEPARDWKVPRRKINPIHFLATYNDIRYPLTTWILAQK